MAQYNRMDVALAMKESGIVPVFYNAEPDVCLGVLRASYQGGARLFEFTNRGDFAHDIFSLLVKTAVKEMPGMIIGAGSVIDPYTAAIYIQNGANFIVSPVLNPEMAAICNRRKILWCPGCGSATEISTAESLGSEIVKIFPAEEVGGPEFVKNIKGPMPWTNIMPTGGVDLEYDNLKKWFSAGVWCVGVGSKLYTAEAVKARDYNSIRSRVSEALALIRKVREDLAGQ